MSTLTLHPAAPTDVAEIAALRVAVADDLTKKHGRGHWSSHATENGVARGIAESRVIVCREAKRIVGTLRLATKKPWAIDTSYFAAVKRALYLVDMAVEPQLQGTGIGRRMLEEARSVAREFPAQAIRLDAYDSPAGAGGFYAACGYAEVGRKAYRGVPLVYYELLIPATPLGGSSGAHTR